MALKIRLRQQGRRNQLVYRLIITDSRSPRDGKYIELLGWYHPLESEAEKTLSLSADRIQHWLDQGAILTEKAATIVKRGAPEVLVAYRQKLAEARAKACQKRKAAKKRKEMVTA